MTWIPWLNTIAETLIAVGMFSVPGSFLPGAGGQAAAIARISSLAIFAVAFISFTASRRGVSAGIYPPLLIPPVIIHTVARVPLGTLRVSGVRRGP